MTDEIRSAIANIKGHINLAHQQINAALAQMKAAEVEMELILNPPAPKR